MINAILLEAASSGTLVLVYGLIGFVIVYFVVQSNKEKEEKRRKAYEDFQEALNGTDKKVALQKGRHYVSLFDKKDQLLEETRIQNDLHGMDDARKNS